MTSFMNGSICSMQMLELGKTRPHQYWMPIESSWCDSLRGAKNCLCFLCEGFLKSNTRSFFFRQNTTGKSCFVKTFFSSMEKTSTVELLSYFVTKLMLSNEGRSRLGLAWIIMRLSTVLQDVHFAALKKREIFLEFLSLENHHFGHF